MTKEEFFRDVPANFPLLRWLASRKDEGYRAELELLRPRDALGYRKARIAVHLFKNGRESDYKDDDWDDGLNAGLIELGVKSRTAEEEKDRFALGLRAALRAPERRYGDGYFNAVLVQYISETDFRDQSEVKGVLEHVHQNKPDPSRVRDDCWQMIEAAVKGRAVELMHRLGYSMNDAWDILAGAMARYVDERFSVTNRRLLGLL